jgi:hypothetical protein
MSIIHKKHATRKELRRTTQIKLKPEIKNIGLNEKIEEAKRLYKSVKNPELLKYYIKAIKIEVPDVY